MSCNLNKSFNLGCRDIGGVDEVYIADWSNVLYDFRLVNEILEVKTWTDGSATYSQYIVTGVKDENNVLFPKAGEFFEVSFVTAPFNVLNDTGIEVINRSYDSVTNILTINSDQPSSVTGSTIGWNGIIINSVIGEEISIMPNTALFYSITQPRETAEWIETPMNSIDNHSSWFEKSITINLFNVASTRDFVNTLTKGRWIVMVKDNNGFYWVLNLNSPANISSASGGSGKLMLDLNGWSITILAKDQISRKLTEGAITRFINGGNII